MNINNYIIKRNKISLRVSKLEKSNNELKQKFIWVIGSDIELYAEDEFLKNIQLGIFKEDGKFKIVEMNSGLYCSIDEIRKVAMKNLITRLNNYSEYEFLDIIKKETERQLHLKDKQLKERVNYGKQEYENL